MDLLEKLSRYLSSQAYRDFQKRPAAPRPERFPFLTISREAGAGGHSLANALLEEMAQRANPLWQGWKVFDAAVCARILEDASIVASLESLDKEETRSAWEEAVYELVGGRASSDRVYRKTFQAMQLLAEMGKIIVIGRGGACATRGLSLGVHVRLVAPPAYRVQRMKQRLQVSEANARRMVEEYDLDRAKFVRSHFGQDIRDPLLYHVIWNTQKTSFEEMAAYLLGKLEALHVASLRPASVAG